MIPDRGLLHPRPSRGMVMQPPLVRLAQLTTGSRFFHVLLPRCHPTGSVYGGNTYTGVPLSPSLMFVNFDHLHGGLWWYHVPVHREEGGRKQQTAAAAPPRVSQPWWSKVDRARFELAAAARVFALLK
jgi:hypothetical protein